MRMGKKEAADLPCGRAGHSRSPRDGRFIEIVGTYAPRGRSLGDPDAIVEIDNVKALKWLRQGSDAHREGREAPEEIGGLGRIPSR